MNVQQFRAELARLVREETEIEASILVAGQLKNMRDYKYHAGAAAALRKIEQLCDLAEKNLTERDR